jgi:hypothetical protein
MLIIFCRRGRSGQPQHRKGGRGRPHHGLPQDTQPLAGPGPQPRLAQGSQQDRHGCGLSGCWGRRGLRFVERGMVWRSLMPTLLVPREGWVYAELGGVVADVCVVDEKWRKRGCCAASSKIGTYPTYGGQAKGECGGLVDGLAWFVFLFTRYNMAGCREVSLVCVLMCGTWGGSGFPLSFCASLSPFRSPFPFMRSPKREVSAG